ncbi:MAG: A24 family peptidase [Acidimicrobiia bacterium]|nr:A24 family peptidase [Acidimicrobiia bacterium]
MTISAADGEVMADGRARARLLISDAWGMSSWPWRATAVAAAVIGVAMGVLGHVPIASGLAVAVLVPPALIDVHYRRLPNRWVGAAAITFVATAVFQVAVGQPVNASDVALGALVLTGPMLVLHLVSPGAMGFGDVKAGIVLGACLGSIGWELALAGLALAAGATSVTAIVSRRSVVAFGPGLVAGALVALAAHTSFVVTPLDSSAHDTPERPTVGQPTDVSIQPSAIDLSLRLRSIPDDPGDAP